MAPLSVLTHRVASSVIVPKNLPVWENVNSAEAIPVRSYSGEMSQLSVAYAVLLVYAEAFIPYLLSRYHTY